jgi:hypothetical protein
MDIIQIVFSALILITLVASVFYSFKYRRQTDPTLRGLFAARMNIYMGIMLVLIAVSQLFFFNDSSVRRIFGTICLLLGLFNLFSGIRSHGAYQRQKR